MARIPAESPNDATGPRGRILDAAESVLRRHGPAKMTVVDVARALGQSHASVYRHFRDKADLLDALVGRWLEAVSAPLGAIADGPGTASERFRAWFLALRREKLRKVTADPEHFAMYHALAESSRDVVAHHVAALSSSLATILASGIASGEFRLSDPRRAANASLNATVRFHHPALIASVGLPSAEEDLVDVIDLLLSGLRAGIV